jgi:MOSC domain-containing protein YiiM
MDATAQQGRVVAVSRSRGHRFSKTNELMVRLIVGHGIEGDAHAGATVQHRSRVAVDPTQPNLRQVHLIHQELFGELAAQGFTVSPGDLGENITTAGIDLLSLPKGALLQLGDQAVIEVTGLRNPCTQLDRFGPGLMRATLGRGADGAPVRKAGVMSIVVTSGFVRPGDRVAVILPERPFVRLERV